jgi:cell division protein FtsQ
VDGGRRIGEPLARGHPEKGRLRPSRRTESLSARAGSAPLLSGLSRRCDDIQLRNGGRLARIQLAMGLTVLGGFAVLGISLGGHGGAVGDAVRNGVEGAMTATGADAQLIQISGLNVLDEATVADIAGIRPGGSLVLLDARAARERLEELPFVAEAKVQKFFPGGLKVEITEREPFAVWQKDGALSIIDRGGVVLRPANPNRLPDLPVIVGAGAPESAAALFHAMAPFPELTARLHAAVLVAGRRWNLVFDSGLVAKMPEGLLVTALEDLDRLAKSDQLIDRDLSQVDLRIAGRITVRPADADADEFSTDGEAPS